MQAQPHHDQASEDNSQLTSYWLSQNPIVFLMHLRELSCRIDQTAPEHAELRAYIKAYLQGVEQLEKELEGKENGRKEVKEQEIGLLEKKLKELSGQVDELTNRLINSKVTIIGSEQKKTELKTAFLRCMRNIYNPLVTTLNQTLAQQSQRNPHEDWTLMQTIEANELSKTLQGCKIINKNAAKMQRWITYSKEKEKELNNSNDRLKKDIVGVFENVQGNLFIPANRRNEETLKTLQKISEGQRKLKELDSKVKERLTNQSRKIINTALYRQGICMMRKPSENNDETFSTEGSSDMELPSTHSQARPTNPQIVFHQEQPKTYVRVLLGVWGAVLAVGTLVLVFT